MKKNVAIYIIITLLACALTGTITYILVEKKDNKTNIKENNNDKTNSDKENNKNEESTKEDGVKLVKTYNLNDKIVKEFEITLNNKVKTINVVFDYVEDDEMFVGETVGIVTGIINGNKVINYIETNPSKTNVFNINKIKDKFNESNFKIIKGKDNKSYLLLNTDNQGEVLFESNLLIFNDELKQIKDNFDGFFGSCSKSENMIISSTQAGYNLENNLNPYYENRFNIDLEDYPRIYVKVDNNKIYYLAHIYDGNKDEGIVEEREYTINNDKLEYKVIKTYKIAEVIAGQVC